MDWALLLISFTAGIGIGLIIAFFLRLIHSKTAREIADELYYQNEKQQEANINNILENVKASFSVLSFKALSQSTDELLKIAKSKLESERVINIKELDSKKNLIDHELQQITTALNSVATLMKNLEKDRVEKFSELATQVKHANEQTVALMHTTEKLHEALANTKTRGQWGERMAEDVLRMTGFIENINYHKQKTIDNNGNRPDFTFLLPNDLKLNMDVKFPFDNYIRYLQADSETDKLKFRNDFLKDVKVKIKEITTRDYINPAQNTVDYALLFIPNEQIYAFIHEQDYSILDVGMKNHVVFCSPVTLYAILVVIRQAVDNFTLEKTSSEILSLLGAFKLHWNQFITKLDLLGKRITAAQSEFESLITTRKRQLEKPLNKIDDLRIQKGLPSSDHQSTDLE